MPDIGGFRSGRDFAAWLGLVPRQNSSGGKERLGRITKMGDRTIRRLLVTGALSVIRWGRPKAGFAERWIGKLVARKPLKLAAVALANKMARIVWAVLSRGEVVQGSLRRAPAAARRPALDGASALMEVMTRRSIDEIGTPRRLRGASSASA